MTVDELLELLERVEADGRPDDAPGLTFVARTSRGLGVRPKLLAEHPNGDRVYMITVGQLRRMVAKAKGATDAR